MIDEKNRLAKKFAIYCVLSLPRRVSPTVHPRHIYFKNRFRVAHAGTLVVEIVFSWPGLGYDALYRAVNDNDFPLLLGTVFIFILIYLVFATLADVAYTIIDPRVRLGSSSD